MRPAPPKFVTRVHPELARLEFSLLFSLALSLSPSFSPHSRIALSLCQRHDSSVLFAQLPAVDLVAEVVVADVLPRPVVVVEGGLSVGGASGLSVGGGCGLSVGGGGGLSVGGGGGSRNSGVGHGRSRGREGGSAVSGGAVSLAVAAAVVRGLLLDERIKSLI